MSSPYRAETLSFRYKNQSVQPFKYEFIWWVFKCPVRTAQKHSVSIIKASQYSLLNTNLFDGYLNVQSVPRRNTQFRL